MINDQLFNKWKHEYIDDLNLDNIEYLDLSQDELYMFLDDNYIDKATNSYASNQKLTNTPIGLVFLNHYLRSDNSIEKRYLIGVANNNKGTKTIISVFKYCNNYYFFEEQKVPLTYIISIEVNQYFRDMGHFNRIVLESLNHIDINNPVITTVESEMGSRIGTIRKLKEIYYNNGFDKDIRRISESNDEYIEMLKGNKPLLIKKQQ